MRRFIEEILPFAFFYFRVKRILDKAADPDIGNKDGEYGKYHQLDTESLCERLKEEHERGKSIDEKTVKFTVSISIALTIFGSIGGYFSKALENGALKLLVSSASGFSVLYTIIGGILALGALKTLPTYGYGTDFVIKAKNDNKIGVSALAAQEKVNTARHLRNEAAYQCLRNGFIIILIPVVLFASAPYFGTPKLQSSTLGSTGSGAPLSLPCDKHIQSPKTGKANE